MKISRELEDKLLAMPGITVGKSAQLPEVPALPLDVDEKQLREAVIQLFERNGWTVFCVRYNYHAKEGFPDVWAAKDRIIHVELKSETGQLDAAQATFRDVIRAAKGEWHLWRPSMWPTIVNLIEGVS